MTEKKKKTEKSQDEEQIQLREPDTSTVTKKKVVYIEIDDEVTNVYDRIKKINSKQIYIVVPKRANLFQSLVNLKILKRKAEDDEKKIYLITNDSNGIHLAQKLGIEVYNQTNAEGKSALFNTETTDERLRITPLKASINAAQDSPPTRVAEKKLSISEILRKSKKTGDIDVSAVGTSEKKKIKENRPKFVIVTPNRHALIGFLAFSVTILLLIVYIALPGVTVYLTPAASVLEKSVNIVLADNQKNRAELETSQGHIIASYPIEVTITKTINHFATGKKFSERATNASGKITIINTTNTPWPLVASTRFQNEDGIVFRLKDAVSVPAATSSGLGKLEVFVSADPVDANGLIVGERGNIRPAKFFLPGLKEDSRSKLYAESYAAMAGGITDYTTYIVEEDLEAAQARLKDELIKSAVIHLKDKVKEKSQLTSGNVTYILLEGEKAVKTDEPKINIDNALIGKEISEFTLSGELKVSGVYYDKEAMLEILKSELLLKKSPQKELVTINENSTNYRIFEWDENKGKIKLTANIKGIEQFEIDPGKENGAKLLAKIKDHIVSKDIEQAKLYIQNLPEINKVEIDSWPAWAPSIPNIPDNIEFEIRDAVAAQ